MEIIVTIKNLKTKQWENKINMKHINTRRVNKQQSYKVSEDKSRTN